MAAGRGTHWGRGGCVQTDDETEPLTDECPWGNQFMPGHLPIQNKSVRVPACPSPWWPRSCSLPSQWVFNKYPFNSWDFYINKTNVLGALSQPTKDPLLNPDCENPLLSAFSPLPVRFYWFLGFCGALACLLVLAVVSVSWFRPPVLTTGIWFSCSSPLLGGLLFSTLTKVLLWFFFPPTFSSILLNPLVLKSFSVSWVLLGGIQMSKQDSSSPRRTFNSIPSPPSPGRSTSTGQGQGWRNSGAQRKRFSAPSRNFHKGHWQLGVCAEEGGQKEEGSRNWVYENWWNNLEVHIPFQREGFFPPVCCPPGSSNAGLGERGPQLGVHTCWDN